MRGVFGGSLIFFQNLSCVCITQNSSTTLHISLSLAPITTSPIHPHSTTIIKVFNPLHIVITSPNNTLNTNYTTSSNRNNSHHHHVQDQKTAHVIHSQPFPSTPHQPPPTFERGSTLWKLPLPLAQQGV